MPEDPAMKRQAALPKSDPTHQSNKLFLISDRPKRRKIIPPKIFSDREIDRLKEMLAEVKAENDALRQRRMRYGWAEQRIVWKGDPGGIVSGYNLKPGT